MSKINFNEKFWDKYEDFHKRFFTKNNSLDNIIDIFSKLEVSLMNFTKAINTVIMKDYILFPEQRSTQNDALEFIKFILTIQTTQFNVAIELIKNRILIPLRQKKEEDLKKEKELYLELKRTILKYNESLINLQKSKEKYHQTANIAEITTKSAKEAILKKLNNDIDKKQQNLYNLLEQKSLESLIEAKKNEEKYVELLKEANLNREDNNKKQYELLNFYKEMEYKDFQFYKCLLLDYLCNLKTENSVVKESLMEMEEKIGKMNIDKDIQILIKLYGSDKKPDEIIQNELYNPKMDIKKCFKDEDYTLYYNTIVTMKSYLNILPDFDVTIETTKQELRELCKTFFSLNINYNDSINKRILDILKEEWTQDFFLVILSKQRTNGRYCRTKKLINDLGIILNSIIDISHKSLNYNNVKTCIILSQTFYYEEKNNKIYLYKSIINNKWLKTPDFWRNIITNMTEIELNTLKEQNKMDQKAIKKSLDNIVFSQILAYTTSMKDFKLDSRIILKIIDEIIKKYELSKDYLDAIYNNLGDEKYIEKLRNEYESMPDLEQKITDAINNEQNNENEKENQINENIENNKTINIEKDNDNKKDEEKNNDNDNNNKIIEQNQKNENNKENDNINNIIENKENGNILENNKDKNKIEIEKKRGKEENIINEKKENNENIIGKEEEKKEEDKKEEDKKEDKNIEDTQKKEEKK